MKKRLIHFEERPTQINKVFQFQVFVTGTELVCVLQQMVIVRSEQHLHLSGGLSVGIEERFHVGLVIFQVTAGFLLRRAAEVGFREILMCYQYTTEKLVLESDPVQGLCNLFGFGTGFTQIIRSLVLYFIRQGRITLSKSKPFSCWRAISFHAMSNVFMDGAKKLPKPLARMVKSTM